MAGRAGLLGFVVYRNGKRAAEDDNGLQDDEGMHPPPLRAARPRPAPASPPRQSAGSDTAHLSAVRVSQRTIASGSDSGAAQSSMLPPLTQQPVRPRVSYLSAWPQLAGFAACSQLLWH